MENTKPFFYQKNKNKTLNISPQRYRIKSLQIFVADKIQGIKLDCVFWVCKYYLDNELFFNVD